MLLRLHQRHLLDFSHSYRMCGWAEEVNEFRFHLTILYIP